MLAIENLAVGSGLFSHEFQPGRIGVILGNNGAGKSTLTRLITGLSPVRHGKISLSGADITDAPVRHRDIALVFQEFVNYPSLTCFENIASPMRAQGIANNVVESEVKALAETLQLSEFLKRMPEALSGGQQQRLAIARALAKKAQVLLLDEPLVNLDYKLRESLLIDLKQLLHDRNCIVIYTSSDTSEAFAVADELVLLEQGSVLQAGDPMHLMQNPASVVCADLMADPGINQVKGLLSDGLLKLDGIDARSSIFAVRPDHLHLTPLAKDNVRFNAHTLFSESNGSDTYLHMSLEPQLLANNMPAIHSSQAVWVAHFQGHHNFIPGEAIELYISAQDLKAF